MRHRRRWLVVAALAVLLVMGAAFAALRIWFDGPRLADKVASFLNNGRRGRIEIGSIEWQPSALKTAITGGWIPVTVHDVRVWDDCALADSNGDPEELRTSDPNADCTPDDKPDPDPHSKRRPRKLLLRSDLLTGEVDAHAAMFGNHDLVLRHVVMHGGEALIEQTREPQPLHAYNKTIVSILSAFYPRLRAGFRAGVYADRPPPVFDLRDIHLEHVNLTINTAPSANDDGTMEYGMSARIEDVNTNDAAVYMDGRDPLVQKFYVRLGVTGKHGHIRIRDNGPREVFKIPGEGTLADAWATGRDAKYEIEVDDIKLDRLAQLPTEWAHFDKQHGYDYVANSLEVDATLHTVPCKTDTGGAPDPKDGALIHITGGLVSYWDRPYDGRWDFKLDANNLGPTVKTCIKKTIGGDHMGGTIALTGPFIALPLVKLDLHDVEVDIPLSKKQDPIELTIATMKGHIDLVNDEGSIDETKARERNGNPGEALLSANFGLKPFHSQADVDILKPIDVGRFLPKKVESSVGRYLVGKLSVDGDVETGFQIYDFNLGLGPSPGSRVANVFVLPRENGRLFASDDFDKISLEKIHFTGGKSNAVLNGKVNWIDDQWEYKVGIEGQYPDLDVWLKRFGFPALAQSAGGGIVITGQGKNATINVSTLLKGVPCIDNVQTNATLSTQTGLASFKISSGGFGGELHGDGVFNTNTKSLDKMHMTGAGLDASRVCGINKTVSGTIDKAELDLHGTIDPKRSIPDWAGLAKVYATMPHAKVYGDSYSDLAVCLNRSDDDETKKCGRDANAATASLTDCADAKQSGGACAVIRAKRDRGGDLHAIAANVPATKVAGHAFPPRLGGEVRLDDVPMAVLAPWVGEGTLGGLFNTVLHLQGTIDAPEASGQIAWLRGWVKDAFVSDPQLIVEPTNVNGMPSVAIHGRMLSDALGLYATIGTREPYPVDVTLSGRRIEVDQFLDLSKKLGLSEPVQAWATGTVELHTELKPKSGKAEPRAWVEITELQAIVDHTSNDGRHVPLRFELQPKGKDLLAMSLLVTPTTISLACRNPSAATGIQECPAQLVTPAGTVEITGSASATAMQIRAAGDLRLDKLGGLLENQLDAIAGTVHLEANINGTFDKPSYDATLTVAKAAIMRPSGADTDLRINEDSQVRILNGVIGFNSFTVAVAGDRGSEASELHVKGTIALAGMKPASWGVLVDGKIAGKLLQIVAPNSVAQAGGVAHIDGDLVLEGKGELPQVNGTISFDPEPGQKAPLSIVARGLRREIAMLGGSIDISTEDSGGHRSYVLDIAYDNAITASIDGEGRLEQVRGHARIRDGVPETATIDLDADNVPYRNGERTLELTFAASDIELSFANNKWTARGIPGSEGVITVVNGAYKRNFDLAEAIKPQPPQVDPARPLWDEYPSIGNADVALKLVVQRFSVDNNIAHIDFQGKIDITGTPKDLRLQGSIGAGAGRGDFKIPLTRAAFAATRGTIDFSPNDRAANPTLNLFSEANYQDLSGQQHVITLTISGTLEQPLWDLRTNTGLDKSQTLALLFLGRSPEQLRRSLGDQSIGVVDPTRGETSTNPSAGVGDQVIKDLAGDWVSSLLGNSLTNLLNVDVLRFELSFGTVGVHAEKKVLENIRIIGDGESTSRGYTLNVHGEVRTPWHSPLRVFTNDRFTLQGVFLDKIYSDPADQAQNITDVQGKVVYRLFIP